MTRIIGITGGIGSGKSFVINLIENNFNVKSINTDNIAKKLMEPDNICYNLIVEYFGTEILNDNMTINRKKLGEIVFNNPDKLIQLNSLTHPYVLKYIKQLIEIYKLNKEKFVIIESALLFDTDLHKLCTETWYVYSDIDIRIERLVNNRGYSKEEARSVIKNQKNEEFYKSKSSLLFKNTTKENVEQKLKELLGKKEVSE